MKKFLLSIVAVVLLGATALVFVACSNVNQINFIQVVARDIETMTYTMQWVDKAEDTGAETVTDIGTMTMRFVRLVDKDYTLNGKDYHIASGGVVTTQLTVAAGEYAGDNMQSTVLFENAFSPVASYKQYVAADQARSYTCALDYTAKKTVQIDINGKSSTFKKPNYCYDNESLYFLARGSDMGQASYSLSVAGVDNQEGGTRTVSLAKAAAKQSVQVPLLDKPEETYLIRLTAASTYGNGTYSDLYFLPSYQYNDNGTNVDINKLLLRIDEGKVRYVLKSFALN